MGGRVSVGNLTVHSPLARRISSAALKKALTVDDGTNDLVDLALAYVLLTAGEAL